MAFLLYFTAVILSGIAAYYSVIGLIAIFSAAALPVAIMGGSLEAAKLVVASWLYRYWRLIPVLMKVYFTSALVILMIITSMGIFGFLSKAHNDQSLVSGDVQSKIAIYDEKIKTAKENIEANRKQLKQMDEAVDQVMARSTDEKGADKANTIRRSQQRDRAALAKDIEANQRLIAKLNDEAAPIRAEIRKVEAEVGPIKYIAAMVYGDNPDANLLESAVRWVIILIVAVFDPLALVLILAAQQSIRWAKEEKEQQQYPTIADLDRDVGEPPTEEEKFTEEEFRKEIENDPELSAFFDRARATAQALDRGEPIPGASVVQDEQGDVSVEKINTSPSTPPAVDPHPTGWMFPPATDKKTKRTKKSVKKVRVPEEEQTSGEMTKDTQAEKSEGEPQVPQMPYYEDLGGDYVNVEGKNIHLEALRGMYPDIWAKIQKDRLDAQLKPIADNVEDSSRQSHATFGTEFPPKPTKGEMFLNVSSLPSRLFKFNGQRWIEVDKSVTDSYTYNEDYLQYLVERINQGLLSPEDLTDSEQDQIAEYLKKNVK